MVPSGEDLTPGIEWALPDCRQLVVTIRQEKGAASEGLPPDHELQGEGLAVLEMVVLDCPSAVVGNVSVVRPFRAALLYHLLLPFGDRPNEADAFLREAVVSDEAMAEPLAAWGLPVVTGTIDLAPLGDAWDIVVEGPGTQVEVTGVPPSAELQPSTRSALVRYRGGDDAAWFWLEDSLQEVSNRFASDPVVVQASDGYLSDRFPLGRTTGFIGEGAGGHHWALGRQEFA